MDQTSNHEARIAVLEKLSENCDQQRQDTLARVAHLEVRLDEHLVTNAKSQLELSISLTRLVTLVENMADDIKQALTAGVLAVKHETIAQALMWFGAAAVSLAAAGWAIFTYGHSQGWF